MNYFLRDAAGKFTNGIRDKHVWVKWMERRVHGEAGAIPAPTGLIPVYEDLVALFREVLGKEYSKQDYVRQFTIRVAENLAKIDRIEQFHRANVPNSPKAVFKVLGEQRKRLAAALAEHGDFASPFHLE